MPNSSSYELPVTSQIFVRKRNSHASLTNGRCDSLDRAQPNVAASKNARRTCFKKVRITAVRPQAGFFQIFARKNVAT